MSSAGHRRTEPPVIKQVELNEDVDPKLRVITGGRDSGHNWLADLKHGCAFLARRKNEKLDPELVAYQVAIKTTNSTQLFVNATDGRLYHMWVDNVRFSMQFECCEILLEGDENGTVNSD